MLVDGSGAVRGLRERLVRVAVPGAPSGADGTDAAGATDGSRGVSPWRYRAVLRADGALERDGEGRPLAWSVAEREAAGLAALDDGPRFAMRVLGHELASDAALPARGCAVPWRLAVPGVARLAGRQRACPVGSSAAGAALATLGPIAVDGTLGPDGEAVSGLAWQRLAWGAVPALGGGAVTFDRAVLALEGVGGLELVRSRRSSGTGRARTTVTALDARARRAGVGEGLEASWDGLGVAEGGASEPAGERPEAVSEAAERDAGRVRVPALGIDVSLRALSPVRARDDGLERAFHGAVIAAGTHRGAGFVDHRPLRPRGPGATDPAPES